MHLQRRYAVLLFILYSVLFVSLFLYSFTQVDLSLTLSRASLWQSIQKSFQYIGYFNRPLSTQIFVVLVSCSFGMYMVFLSFAQKQKITSTFVWRVIIAASGILMFSYNAFSYDIFNYMFDAKIFTLYQQNPYLHKALDFPGDPYLSFMQWTHRVYPYGPVWLFFSVILSFAGLQYFLPTFFLFKFLMAGAFLGTAYFIYKISQLTNKQPLFSLVFFALNPIVFIESLISGHNDIVMMSLAMGSLYFLVKKQYTWSYTLLLLSIGIKFATVFLLPLYLYEYSMRRKKQTLSWQTMFVFCVVLMVGAVIVASIRSNFQPWYLLYVLPFASLLGKRYYVLVPVVLVSAGALLRYMPFLWFGNWDPPIPLYLSMLLSGSILVSAVCTFAIFLRQKRYV